jgi:hypothetical protein
MIAYVRGGRDIKFNQPAATAWGYEWHRLQCTSSPQAGGCHMS